MFEFVEEALVGYFVECFLEIDGVCLYSIIVIVCAQDWL